MTFNAVLPIGSGAFRCRRAVHDAEGSVDRQWVRDGAKGLPSPLFDGRSATGDFKKLGSAVVPVDPAKRFARGKCEMSLDSAFIAHCLRQQKGRRTKPDFGQHVTGGAVTSMLSPGAPVRTQPQPKLVVSAGNGPNQLIANACDVRAPNLRRLRLVRLKTLCFDGRCQRHLPLLRSLRIDSSEDLRCAT
jgi:hypothetical protein